MFDNGENSDVDSQSYLKLTHLYTAITQHFAAEEVDGILQNTGDINYRFPQISRFSHQPELIGATILHFAINYKDIVEYKLNKNKNFEIFKLLLDYGADYTLKNKEGSTALHQAADKIEYCQEWISKLANERISEILSRQVQSQNPANPCSSDGISHFHIACMTNHKEAVSFFLENGIPVDQAISMSACYFPGYTALHFAVRFCAIETIEILLSFHANLYIQDGRVMTPMHVALERKVKVLDLINRGRSSDKNLPSVMQEYENVILLNSMTFGRKDFVDNLGLTHFHIACTMEDTSMVEQYLQQIDDIDHFVEFNSPVCPGYTALHFAGLFNVKIVQLLLKNGANMKAKDANGTTPFDMCVESYKLVDVHSVISSHPVWKDITFSDGKTGLLDVIMDMSDSDYQLECKNMNIFIPFSSSLWPGYTPLHIIVVFADRSKYESNYRSNYYYGKESDEPPKIFEPRCIIDYKYFAGGLNLTAQDAFGSTPIHLAFQLQKPRAVEILTDKMKVIDSVNNDNLSHLHIAVAEDDTVLFTKLLKNGAAVNLPLHNTFEYFKDSYDSKHSESFVYPKGSTALHIAAARNSCGSIKVLLELGASVYAKDENGMTPIHKLMGTSKGSYKSSQNLPMLNNRIHESSNLSHLHVASHLGETEAVKKLLDRGADINAAIKCVDPSNKSLRFLAKYEDFTPLHIACKNYHDGASDLIIPLAAHKTYNDGVFELLIERGADIFAPSAKGVPLLYEELAYNSSISRIFFSILEKNEDMRRRMFEETGLTMLHLVSHQFPFCNNFNNYTIFGRWIDKSDINARSNDDSPIWPGCTALDVLIEALYYDTGIEWATDSETESVSDIEIAESWIDTETLIEIGFLRNGADVTLANSESTTAIHKLDRCNRAYKIKEDDNRQRYLPEDYGYCGLPPSPTEPTTIEVECTWNKSAREADEIIPHSSSLYKLMKGQKNFDVNPSNSDGISHFHVACLNKYYDVVEIFFKHNVDVNTAVSLFSDEFPGCTPLHLTMINCVDPKLTQLLLDHGADVHARDVYGNTPLHFAAKNANNNLKVFQMLIDKGASIDARNSFGDTPLNVVLYRKLHSHRFIDTENKLDRTSDSSSDTAVVEFFLRQGFRIHTFHSLNQTGWIPEALAECYNTKYDEERRMYDTILDAPDFLETSDEDDDDESDEEESLEDTIRDAPDSLETDDGEKSLYDTILAAPDLFETDGFGRTSIHNIASHWCSSSKAIRLLKTLAKQGCSVDQQDAIGRSALHIAVQFRNVAMVTELLKLGADINLQDSNGKVPFNYCFEPNTFIVSRRSFLYEKGRIGQDDNKKINRIFVEYINILKLIGLDVCENNLAALMNSDQKIRVDFNSFNEKLTRLKSIKIQWDEFSFDVYKLLSETKFVIAYPNMLETKRQAIDNFFKSGEMYKVCENLHEFVGVLNLQYNKAVERESLIEDADDSLNTLAGFKVPYLISDMIIKLLSNLDLKNLKASVEEMPRNF